MAGQGETGSGCSLPPSPQDVPLRSKDTPGAICCAKPFFLLSVFYMDGGCRSELAPTHKWMLKKINSFPLPSLLPQLSEKVTATIPGMLHTRLPRRRPRLQETNKPPSILLVQQNRSSLMRNKK